jgi:hypothetical protein
MDNESLCKGIALWGQSNGKTQENVMLQVGTYPPKQNKPCHLPGRQGSDGKVKNCFITQVISCMPWI